MNIVLQQCRRQDLPVLRKVAIETFKETFAADNTLENTAAYIGEAFSPEQLERELDNPASTVYLALEEGEVVGFIKLNNAPAQTDVNDKTSLEIERIYVLKKFHGTGCGRLLLDKAITCAVEAGKKYVWLGVWEQNHRAIRFYEKNGFTRFGEHIFQLGDDAQRDYLLRKSISPN